MSGSDIGWPQSANGSIGNTVTVLSINPGRLGGYFVDNPNASQAYLQIFDANSASSITLGTTAPKLSFGIPANGAANLSISDGIRFLNGIVIAVTTTRTGGTGPASTVDYNIWFS
jgi:hypothetical protein